MTHDAVFAPASDVVLVANEAWEDESVIEYNFSGTNLAAGEEEEVVRIESTKSNVKIAVGLVATTLHANDIDSDGNPENTVRYRLEHKEDPGDPFSSLPGMTTTMPFGSIGDPVPIVPNVYVGPMAAFRIVFRNRSDESGFSSTPVDNDELGAQASALVLRNDTLDHVQEHLAMPGGER